MATGEDHGFLQGDGPLYRRVATNLRAAIESGQFPSGQKLPSTRELRRQLGVSLSTIHQALRLLEAEGLLDIRPQSGSVPRPAQRAPASSVVVDPIPVRRGDLAIRLLQETNREDLLRLGGTMPNPLLLPTAQIRRRAARLGREGWPNRYEFCWGTPELRQQIARLSAGAGLQIDPDEVFLTQGCLEAVGAVLSYLCHEGDTVAVESPTFFGHLEALEARRLRSLEVPSSVEEGICLLSLETAFQRHKVSCLLVTPNYSNPQGSLMPDHRKRQLVALAARYGVPIIENDVHGELAYAERRPLALRAFDRQGRVYLCSSFSKTLGPEWRVGWLLPARMEDRRDFERLLTFHSFGGNSLIRQALAEYLSSGDYSRAIAAARRAHARHAAAVYGVLRKSLPQGSHLTLPQGGKMIWVELPPYYDALELYQRCRPLGITISPGHLYSVNGHHSHCFRVNCSYFDSAVEAGLLQLCQILSEV